MFNYQDDDSDRRWTMVDRARRFKGCLNIAVGVVMVGLAGLFFYEDGWQSIRPCLVMLLIAAVNFGWGYYLVRPRH